MLGLYKLKTLHVMCRPTLHVFHYCRFYSSKQVDFQHKLYPSQWILKPTMLISSLHCLRLHSTQGRAKRSTLYSDSESIMSMERCYFIVQNYLWQSSHSTVHFNLGLGFIKNACRLYSKARGRGAPAVKKLVLLRRRTDVLFGRPTTSAIDVIRTSYIDVLHDVATTLWGVHASTSSVDAYWVFCAIE